MSNQEDIERRALAAEKTVEVLKRKVLELYNDDQSSVVRQLRAATKRSEESRRKREIAEVRAGALARYSETLEAEVAPHREAIKTILDHVTFGFLVVGRDLVVLPETTRSCVRLFGRSDIEGQPLPALLALSSQCEQQFVLGADQVFEDVLPEEVSLAQMPQTFSLPDGRIVRAEGSVIRSADGEVRALLFTISDISALVEATRESQTNRMLVGILKQKEAFSAFLLEAQEQVRAARVALGDGDQVFVRRVVHTIKGNAASYGMTEIVELIHHIEEAAEVGTGQIDAIVEGLRGFLRRHYNVIEIDYERAGAQAYAVTLEQISQVRGILDEIRGVDGTARDRLHRWTAGVLARPAGQLIGPMPEFVERLAERLGKRVELVLQGEETIVDVETMRPVLMSLSHLLRNSIDHGIEAPSARGPKGPKGHLSVRFEDLGDAYGLEVEDDGRGIDLPKLRAGAVARGLATEAQIARRSDGGVGLIFLDGLSTALETTYISGRGVGMSAVKSAVEGVGGTLAVSTTMGLGTTFTMRVPKRGALSA